MPTFGFVGVAHIHTPSFVRTLANRQDVTVRSVWDPEPARATRWAGELGATLVDDAAKVFRDKEIDAVVICSQTDQHLKLVKAACRAGKHLFVEKPLGMGSRDAYAMARAIDQAGVIFQTGYFMRGWPAYQFIRQHIARGSFGKITRIRGSNCHSGSLGGWFDAKPDNPSEDWRWMADPKQAGVGAFGDLGTHVLDIMLWMMGPVDQCTAQVDDGTARYEGCDETGEGLLRFSNGVIGTLAAAWDDVANPVSFLLSGTEGHAAIIDGKLYFQSKHVEGADGQQPWSQLPPAWPHAFDNFVDAVCGVEGAKDKLVSAQEAAYRSAVTEALYQGAAKRKWVSPRAPTGV